MTDGVTDNIVVRGCPGSIPGWVLKKKKKKTTYICIILYISYMHVIYIYILHIYVESKVSGI